MTLFIILSKQTFLNFKTNKNVKLVICIQFPYELLLNLIFNLFTVPVNTKHFAAT